MKRWYAIQTKSHQEAVAIQHLKDQRFNTFFPKYMKKEQTKRTGTVYLRPTALFPSYVFVEFDVTRNRRWQTINGTKGVVCLVGYLDDYLSPLPIGCVEEIMQRADRKGFVQLEATLPEIIQFSPEMQLTINRGSLQGTVATYCNHSDNRVTLLLALLNQKVKIELPIDAVSHLPVPTIRR